MKQSYESKYHRLEENNWWFRGRRDIICSHLESVDKDARILDIGCSSGVLLENLQKLGYTDIWGLDISPQAVKISKSRGLVNVSVGDGISPPYDDEFFDVIVASDVIEHIQNDDAALDEWNRILKPDGFLLLFAPAFPSLWSAHDVANRHYRRYTDSTLAQKVKTSGFLIKRQSYWNITLFFPVSILRKLTNDSRDISEVRDDLHELPSFANLMLTYLLMLENRILSFVDYPVGVSVFIVAQKP